MAPPPHPYRPEVLAELERFGLRPLPTTPPARAYELLKAIYCFEIREMKLRRREAERILGPQPLAAYRRGLERLKAKYAILERPAVSWVFPSGGGVGR